MTTLVRAPRSWRRFVRPRPLLTGALLVAWLLVLIGLPIWLPTLTASWLTFFGFLIAPGYLLADVVARRTILDELERLAVALPLGIFILAVPGTWALLTHTTLDNLFFAWSVATAAVAGLWLFTLWRDRRARRHPVASAPSWRWDESLLAGLLVVGFALALPSLNLHKIDGDAYAVNAFAADALAGLPLNEVEPIFGSDLGPGVRMIFNQALTFTYLWSFLADVDPNALIAEASRPMLAAWAILAAYLLGKAAGLTRRFGLFVAAIQLLIYLAAPFLRSDNVSLFFFERTNADKFMVPVTMLPVVFAFAIRYARHGRRADWSISALATLAVSTIHPLIAAMLALAMGAFGACFLWMGRRSRRAWRRTIALGCLAGLVMILPIIQLVLSRGDAPLAASYPASFDGWPINEVAIPALPFVDITGLGLYGPLPELTRLEARDANETTNPFLMWRFAVNMNRRRLILFDRTSYISDPSLVLEPPYLLALLSLPYLWLRRRRDEAAQFSVGAAAAVLVVMFNPLVTPLIGSLVMPWILWRLVWLLPYTLLIALTLATVGRDLPPLLRRLRLLRSANRVHGLRQPAALLTISAAALLLSPAIQRNLADQQARAASPVFYPTPTRLFAALNQSITNDAPATVLAGPELSVTLPAYVANAAVVAHRAPTTSEVFPADQQAAALQRLIDQNRFFSARYLTADALRILEAYDVAFVVTDAGSAIDMQLRLAPTWFEWLLDDQSFTLYRVRAAALENDTLRGNALLESRDWPGASALFRAVLAADRTDLLAHFGLAEAAHAQGHFDRVEGHLENVLNQADLPLLHYRLGQLYAERGQWPEAIAAFERASAAAPNVAQYRIALGDACLDRDIACASAQFAAAVANQNHPDEAARNIALGDLWRRRGRLNFALPLYEAAVARAPSPFNKFILESAYREAGAFDHAADILAAMRAADPLSPEIVTLQANAALARGDSALAADLYRDAVWLRQLRAQEPVDAQLGLAQALLTLGRLEEAHGVVATILRRRPNHATAYRLQGDLYRAAGDPASSIDAYRRAFELDPTRLDVYIALDEQLRAHGTSRLSLQALLEAAIDANPNAVTLHLALGDQLLQLGDTAGAIDAFQVALQTIDIDDGALLGAPGNSATTSGASRAFIYARLARAHEDLGQIAPAMNYYRATVAAAPRLAWTEVALGDALRLRNNLDAAEAAYRRALTQDSTDIGAHIRLADLLYARDESEAADALYLQAFSAAYGQVDTALPVINAPFPNTSNPLVDNPLYQSDEPVEAQSANSADQALAAELGTRQTAVDENVNTIFMLARLYARRGRPEAALALYDRRIAEGRAVGWSPRTLARYYTGQGDVYLSLRRLANAIDAYQTAVDLDGTWPDARLGLARAYIAWGDADAALTHLETAVAITPGSLAAQLALADALDEAGRRERALAVYQSAAVQHPGSAQANLALARAWQDRGRWDRAAEAYYAALTMAPGLADPYIGLAELALYRADYTSAENLLEQALAADRQNVNSYVRLVELEQGRGNPDRALAWYRQAAARPSAGQSNIALVDALMRFGNYHTALDYIQSVLAGGLGNDELLLRLAAIQARRGRPQEAEAILISLTERAGGDDRAFAALAELVVEQGRPAAAIPIYNEALARAPGEVSYYLALSQLWLSQGEADQALTILEEGVSAVNQPAALYAAQATFHLQHDRPELALPVLEEALATLGDSTDLLVALGNYYINRADIDAAEEHLERARALDPNVAAVHLALAEIQLRRGRFEQAIAQFERAIALEPTVPGHLLALANAYRLLDRPADAIATIHRALAVAPTLVDTHIDLAALYTAADRPDDARETYERGLEVAPASGELLAGYAAFLLLQGETQAALEMFNAAVAAEPTANTLTARAAAAITLGDFEAAAADLAAAREQSSASVDVLVALGDLHQAAGDAAAAAAAYQAAVDALPGLPLGYLRLSALANAQGDLEEAQRLVDSARQVQPGVLLDPEQLPTGDELPEDSDE